MVEKEEKKINSKFKNDNGLAIILAGIFVAISIIVSSGSFEISGSYIVGASNTTFVNTNLHDGAGNPIGSLDNAINVHDADVHKIPINEFFHEHTGVETTLAAATNNGDTSIIVVDATGFNVGDTFQIENGIIEVTFPVITNIVGTTFTLDRPLDNAFSIGDNVEGVNFNMAVVGSLANPVSFKLVPDGDQTWHIYRFLIGIIIDSAADDSRFGNIAGGLENGVILRAYNGQTNTTRTFTNWKTNGDMKMDMFDLVYTDKAGGGNFGVNGRASVKIASGATPTVNGSAGDYIELLIQDDLTDLIIFNQKGQGHIESQ